jgi:hypothetical protein
MALSRPTRKRRDIRASIMRDRRQNNARREREVVREAIRMRALSPARRIQLLIDLSDFCVKLGRSPKDG